MADVQPQCHHCKHEIADGAPRRKGARPGEYWHVQCAVVAELSIQAHETRAERIRCEMDEIIASTISRIADTDARVAKTQRLIRQMRAAIQQSREVLHGSYALLHKTGG